MVVRFQSDSLVAPRAARTSALRSTAERSAELANQAELTTAALEGGAMADMRADQASREVAAGWAGGPAPASSTLSFRPEGRTLAETQPLPTPPVPPVPPPAAPMGQSGQAAAPTPGAAGSTPPTPSQQPTAAPPPQGPTPSSWTPGTAPTPPPFRGASGAGPAPAPVPPMEAGAGNPTARARSDLWRSAVQRFAAIPGGGSMAFRLASQEVNRDLAVMGTVLQMAQTNPEGALAMMREHGVQVTPETMAMIQNGAIRQRALAAITEANARFGTNPRTAGRRLNYVQGRLTGRQPQEPSVGPQPPAFGAIAAQPQGPSIEPEPFRQLGSGRIVQNQTAGTQEEPGQVYPEYVPSVVPGIGGPSLLSGTGIELMMPPPGMDPTTPQAPMFNDYQAQDPGLPDPQAGRGGARPAAAPRAAGAGNPVDRKAQANASAMRWAMTVRVPLPGNPDPQRLTNPEALSAAAQAFQAFQAGDRDGYVRGMREATRLQIGRPPGGGNNGLEDAQTDPGTEPQGFMDRMWGYLPNFSQFLPSPRTGPNFMGGRPGFQPSTPDGPFSSTPRPRGPTGAGMAGLVPDRTQGNQPMPMAPPPMPEPPMMGPSMDAAPSNAYESVPRVIYENGAVFTFSDSFTPEGRPIYRNMLTGEDVVPE